MKLFSIYLIAVAGFLALPAQAGNADTGKQKSQVCASCHGADGNSATPDFPRLAGQNADYLVAAMKQYKSDERKNPIMKGFVANLSDSDMEDLAAYFSQQKGLSTGFNKY